jgi:hypothetical protein
MLFELAIAAYAAACGFVAAGVLASLYQLVTDKPPRFAIDLETIGKGLAGILLCAFAGPFIIMRNAIRGRTIENRPVGWLVASTAIATGWSLCSGIVVVQFALAMRAGLI